MYKHMTSDRCYAIDEHLKQMITFLVFLILICCEGPTAISSCLDLVPGCIWGETAFAACELKLLREEPDRNGMQPSTGY